MLRLKGALLVVSLQVLFRHVHADVIPRGEDVFLLNAFPLDPPLDYSTGPGRFLTRTAACAPGYRSYAVSSVTQITQATVWTFHKHHGRLDGVSKGDFIATQDGQICLRAGDTVYVSECSQRGYDQPWLLECDRPIEGLCVLRLPANREVLALDGENVVLVEFDEKNEQHYWKLVSSTGQTSGVRSWGVSKDSTGSVEKCEETCQNDSTCLAITYDNETNVNKCHMHYGHFTTNSYSDNQRRWIGWFKSESYSGVKPCEQPQQNSDNNDRGDFARIPAGDFTTPPTTTALTTSRLTSASKITTSSNPPNPPDLPIVETITARHKITATMEVPDLIFSSTISGSSWPPKAAEDQDPGAEKTPISWEVLFVVALGLVILILSIAAVAILSLRRSNYPQKDTSYSKVPPPPSASDIVGPGEPLISDINNA